MLWKNYGKAMEFLFWGSVRTLYNATIPSLIYESRFNIAFSYIKFEIIYG